MTPLHVCVCVWAHLCVFMSCILLLLSPVPLPIREVAFYTVMFNILFNFLSRFFTCIKRIYFTFYHFSIRCLEKLSFCFVDPCFCICLSSILSDRLLDMRRIDPPCCYFLKHMRNFWTESVMYLQKVFCISDCISITSIIQHWKM